MKIRFPTLKRKDKAKAKDGIQDTLTGIKLGIYGMVNKNDKLNKSIAEQRELIDQVGN